MSAAEQHDPNPRLTAALFYISKGWRVVPLHTPVASPDGGKCSCRRDCGTPGKHPRTQHGLKDATIDEQKVRRWWSVFPDANVGVVTGEIADGSYLVLLDEDPLKGGRDTLDQLEQANGKLPETAHSLTGSGGRHFLFTSDRPVSNSVEKLGAGLDVRGVGGYFVAPPSLHASGLEYAWELSSDPSEVPPASLPSWLYARVNERRGAQPGRSEPTPDAVAEGGRNDALFRLASSLRAKGLSVDAVFAALIVENQRICRPPLDEVEVKKISDSVGKYAPGQSDEFKASRRSRFRVVGQDEVPPPPSPDPAPGNEKAGAPDGTFYRGDSIELAERVLVDLQGLSPEGVVYDRNEFWRYVDASGVWQSIPADAVYRAIARFAGAPSMTKDGVKALKLSDAAIAGAARAAANLAARPGFFNDAPAGIAFSNGFAVVRGGAVGLEPHSPDHRALHLLPFEFDATAPAPRWRSYLEQVFTYPAEHTADDAIRQAIAADRQGRIALLQEHLGACLLGEASKHAVCLVLAGEGANGKSVYLQVVKALFPELATASIAPQLWENRFYLAELAGIRLNAVAELPERDILDSESFKAVVSGDPVMVARKHQRPFTLKPAAGHLFACNALPGTKDQSEGFWRRFLVVPFDRTFAPHERDLNLASHLLATELPGVAAWALEGAAALARRGHFAPPPSSQDAKDEWQRDSDQVRQFVEEATVPGGRLSPSLAFEAYAYWSRKTGHGGLNRRRFWQRLGKLLPQTRDKVERFYERSIRPEWTPPRDGLR